MCGVALPVDQVGSLSPSETEGRLDAFDEHRDQDVAVATFVGLVQHVLVPHGAGGPHCDDAAGHVELALDLFVPPLASRERLIRPDVPSVISEGVKKNPGPVPVFTRIAQEYVRHGCVTDSTSRQRARARSGEIKTRRHGRSPLDRGCLEKAGWNRGWTFVADSTWHLWIPTPRRACAARVRRAPRR